jgi:hypothetical protein
MASSDLISIRRESVYADFEAATKRNQLRFTEGDVTATEQYIFPNQRLDAHNIVEKFYRDKCRVISTPKKTKVGADGLMIMLAVLMTTHSDDEFVIDPRCVRIVTGMSNLSWERDMIDKAPACFKDKIFHHGKLSRAELVGIRNGLIIIDEIDTGDKELQVLHNTLKDAGVLDVKYMEENNIRFVFISATMIRELHDLYKWGAFHELYPMTIPAEYVGHKEMVTRGLIKEFYSVSTKEAAEKWIQEDILDRYASPCMCQACNPEQNPAKKDYRIHIVRGTAKTAGIMQAACIAKGVLFMNHTSTDRISPEELHVLFSAQTNHVVLEVKNFYRRANLIPNQWKMRIGATMERHTKTVDNNVQIQGLPGRMTGYWRKELDGGHKTGPHRTSLRAIDEYEATYADPFGEVSYETAGFTIKKGKITAATTMLSPKNILNLTTVEEAPAVQLPPQSRPIVQVPVDPTSLAGITRGSLAQKLLFEIRPDLRTLYKDFEPHCWTVKPENRAKWCVDKMLQTDAMSTVTNIHEAYRNRQVLMIYKCTDMLIVSPWDGAATTH